MALQMLSSLLQRANSQGSKSTALQSMTWIIATIVAAIFTGRWVGLNDMMVWTLIVFLGLALAVTFGMNIYFAIKKPDLLRSERYGLQKLVIESKLGDDVQGFGFYDDIKVEGSLLSAPNQTLAIESESLPSSPETKKKPRQVSKPKKQESTDGGIVE